MLALREKEREAEEGRAELIADIGDELSATKAALDRTPDKAAWLPWLSGHVEFAARSAQHCMSVARLRRKIRKRFRIFARLMPGVKGTAWAAFNAVTEYVDHTRTTRGGQNEDEARASSLLFGSGASLKQKAWDAAVSLIAA